MFGRRRGDTTERVSNAGDFFRWKVQRERFDRDQAVATRVERTKDWSKNATARLV